MAGKREEEIAGLRDARQRLDGFRRAQPAERLDGVEPDVGVRVVERADERRHRRRDRAARRAPARRACAGSASDRPAARRAAAVTSRFAAIEHLQRAAQHVEIVMIALQRLEQVARSRRASPTAARRGPPRRAAASRRRRPPRAPPPTAPPRRCVERAASSRSASSRAVTSSIVTHQRRRCRRRSRSGATVTRCCIRGKCRDGLARRAGNQVVMEGRRQHARACRCPAPRRAARGSEPRAGRRR